MDDKCKDCGQAIYRDEKDFQYFKNLMEKMTEQGREFTMPKRCFGCRAKKKARFENNS